jgi:diguanylate cyclase (GGDEF)-like protein
MIGFERSVYVKMSTSVRSSESKAPTRQGGAEFAIVLPETTAGAAALVARRICDLLGQDAETPKLSVSVELASYPSQGDSVALLLQAADRELCAMKSRRTASNLIIPAEVSSAISSDFQLPEPLALP